MTEEKDSGTSYDGNGLKGPLYWLAGTATAAAVKALSGPGGLLGGLFGGMPPPGGPGAPVSREVLDLTTENATLKANAHADAMNAAQAVVNATQQAQIACQQRQIDQLFTLTQLSIPNANLNPGYGQAVVTPATPPAGDLASTIASAVAAAVAASQKEAA